MKDNEQMKGNDMIENNDMISRSKVSLDSISSLVSDLSLECLSNEGRRLLTSKLLSVVDVHRSSIEKLLLEYAEYKKSYLNLKTAFDKIKDPDKDFRAIAKQLNFPEFKATSDGNVTNPNIEMPFEDPVPKKDIDFMKNYLPKKALDEVVLPKDEQLSKKEIAMYTDVKKAIAEDNKQKKGIKDIAKLNKKDIDQLNGAVNEKSNFKQSKNTRRVNKSQLLKTETKKETKNK